MGNILDGCVCFHKVKLAKRFIIDNIKADQVAVVVVMDPRHLPLKIGQHESVTADKLLTLSSPWWWMEEAPLLRK